MRSIVLDASAALAWLLPSQATDAATAFLDQADAIVFEAPAIFEWEVCNVLVGMARRGLLPGERYERAFRNYRRLDVQLHAPAMEIEDLASLARALRLSLFDVSYFALALDQGWPLASRDETLLTVAAACDLECFDLRATAK
ncbi:type II toxin-antitoxin system VapC family toxin [Caulobacter sp. LjRoot300]|uniref:type II toxin-antitoxin system VapC family toxin n=1 Tax=Caulobacter sp. LjRoot300 TaxID=3342321 RepID=UPI003F501CAB